MMCPDRKPYYTKQCASCNCLNISGTNVSWLPLCMWTVSDHILLSIH